ncbi:hypothetical protein BwSF12_55140 [Bradyrhizobium ottawaense]|uniref:hypothetical protein n=1 Tax=Bradyrhizobium ottawaense TaxID=931866 RepID=UPI0027D69B72|nr:hypothetical protein BwSF12_55140 [Bradyrhizobium ottawaense]GMO95763.1 hypothetical protein BwSF19_76210 [Bradyrhizobium ottawaense]
MTSAPTSQGSPSPSSGADEAIIIVKAAPQLSGKHGETVCTAAVTRSRQWVRLYPIAFRTLQDAQQFSRWDVVRYTAQRPRDDKRIESRRLDHQSLTIGGSLPQRERYGLIAPMVVESLEEERAQGRSLAFIRPKITRFIVEKKPVAELEEERQKFQLAAKQTDLFLGPIIPYAPCPYRFKYDYEIKDGKRTGTCQDWETEATFFNWQRQYSEEETIKKMKARWGEEMPSKGLLFAMGTHSQYPDTWLINGLVQMAEFGQLSLDL